MKRPRRFQRQEDLTQTTVSIGVVYDICSAGLIHTQDIVCATLPEMPMRVMVGGHLPDDMPHTISVESDAVWAVVAERMRQIHHNGFDADHDDCHSGGELTQAAGSYLAFYSQYGLRSPTAEKSAAYVDQPRRILTQYWPFEERWWKPESPRATLVKAASLIIAEIERLDRVDAV